MAGECERCEKKYMTHKVGKNQMVGKDLCILEESFDIILKMRRSCQKTSSREVHDSICTLERSFWKLCGEWTEKEGTGRTEVNWKAIAIFYT